MNILEVHEADYLKKPIFEFIEIPEALSLMGHDVTMVDFGDKGNKIFSLKTKTFRGNRVFSKSKVRVIRPGAIHLGQVFAHFIGIFTSWALLRKLFKKKRFDAIILYSVPTNGWIVTRLAKKYGVPVFFRTLDILHDLRSYGFPIRQIIKSLEQKVYGDSDYMLALTPRLGKYTKHKRILPLYPAVNDKLFYPISADSPELFKLRKKYGINKSDKLIMFLGTFYEFGGLDMLIKNIKKIRAKVPEARLLLVGGAVVEDELRQLAKDEGVAKDVIFTGFVPYAEVTNYINLATLCINSFRDCKATRDIIPAKLFQYLACKKPLLSRRLKGTMDILPETSKAVEYATTDKEIIKKTIMILSDDRYRNQLMVRGYDFTIKYHSWPAFIKKLEGYLKKYGRKISN